METESFGGLQRSTNRGKTNSEEKKRPLDAKYQERRAKESADSQQALS